MLYDSHCHLDWEDFDEDRDAVITRARAVGVRKILVPGVSPAQWSRLPPLRARYPEVRLAVGVHPHSLHFPESAAITAEALAAKAEALGAVAIGECGFDRRVARTPGMADTGAQRRAFAAHIEAARALGLPLIIHAVDAHGPLLAALAAHGPLPAGGVLHAFTGPADLIPRYAKHGLSFALGGAVTRPNARRPKEAARLIPEGRLLLETDAPDLTPTGVDTKRNEPAFLVRILEAVAALRGEPPEQLAERAYENAAALFDGEGLEGPTSQTASPPGSATS
jgi:TatD DNase family protein